MSLPEGRAVLILAARLGERPDGTVSGSPGSGLLSGAQADARADVFLLGRLLRARGAAPPGGRRAPRSPPSRRARRSSGRCG
jgi:hypothetical protein